MPGGADKHAKTEKPTPKRRRESRERGQVARSPDITSSAALLLGSFLVPMIFAHAESTVMSVMTNTVVVSEHPTVAAATSAFESALRAAFFIILPIAAVFMVFGVATNIGQVGLNFSFKAARPRLSRISPREGLKRMFSPQTSFGLARQIAKLSVIGAVATASIEGLMHTVRADVPVSTTSAIGLGSSTILGFVRTTALLGLAIGVGDFAFQRHKLMQGLRMTKQEVKDEARAQEGDPAIKGELRKRQYAIARSQMIAAVRTADVIATNPTHVAVALQYDVTSHGAPRVVAKGVDLLAARIREEALNLQIPIVEDPPLARYLYTTCDIGQSIPVEIYVAVAKLLAFVYSLPEQLRGVRVHHHPPSAVPYDPPLDAVRPPRAARAMATTATTERIPA